MLKNHDMIPVRGKSKKLEISRHNYIAHPMVKSRSKNIFAYLENGVKIKLLH